MFYGFNDKSIRRVGRWAILKNSLLTTAPGSKLEITFSGDMITLYFDMKNNEFPFPHLWLSLDGGAFFETTLEYFVRVKCDKSSKHVLTVIYKGGQEITSRWFGELVGKIEFLGYDAEANAEPVESKKKTIEFIGDSITEGIGVDVEYKPFPDEDQPNRPYQHDSLGTYAYVAAKKLGLEPIISAYGGVGVTRGGGGQVPPADEMYPYYFDGYPKDYSSCDYIVINMGTNDRYNVEIFSEKYYKFLEVVFKYNPNSKIFIMIPFMGVLRTQIIDTVNKFNFEKNTNMIIIDTEGWIPSVIMHPDRRWHKKAGEKLATVLGGLL